MASGKSTIYPLFKGTVAPKESTGVFLFNVVSRSYPALVQAVVPPFKTLTSLTPIYFNIAATLNEGIESDPYNTTVVSAVIPLFLANSSDSLSDIRFHTGAFSTSPVSICTAPLICPFL